MKTGISRKNENSNPAGSMLQTGSGSIARLALLMMLLAGQPALAETYSYDEVGRLATVAFDDGSSIGYQYDKAGNITQIARAPGALPPDGEIDTPDDDVTIDAGQSVDFTATVSDPDNALPLVIRWDFDGAAPDSDEEDPGPVTFADVGTYTVELNVTDATGLSDPAPATRVITVQAVDDGGGDDGGGDTGNGDDGGDDGGSGSLGLLELALALAIVLLHRLFVNGSGLTTHSGRRSAAPVIGRGRGAVLPTLLLALMLPGAVVGQNQWIQLDPGTEANLNDVWGTSPDNVFVVGAGGTILRFDGNVWTPMDSGTTADLNAVYGRGPDEIYAVGAAQTFLRFDGTSWAPFAGPADATTAFVDVWSAGAGEPLWVLSARRAWYWDGAVWTVQSFRDNLNASLTPNAEMRGIGGTASSRIVVSRPAGGTDQVDGGLFANFRQISEYDTRGVYAASDSDIFAVGRNSYRFQGDDVRNAGQWRPISIMREAFDAWGSSASNVYAVGIGDLTTGGQISHYDGNGTNTWTKVFEVGLFRLNSIWGASEADIFVVGNGGVVLRYAEAEAPQTAANFPNSGWAGDFVNAHTGELVLEQIDFAFNACVPFEFARYYASGLTPEGQAGGSLGPNWAHSFEWKILHDADTATITTWRGRTLEFARGAAGWDSTDPSDTGYTLLEDATSGDLILVDDEAQRLYVFDANRNRLTRIEDRFGNRLTIEYSIATGKPVFVSDGKGLAIELIYGLEELASIRTGVEGAYREVVFEYTAGQLTSVTDPEQARTDFLYESPAGDRLITAVRLPEGNVPYTWTYGADSRVASETDAFANASTIAYQSATTPTAMQAPDGSDIRLQHDDEGRLVALTSGEGETTAMAYDGAGRVTSVTAPTGVVTTLEYDPATGRIVQHGKSGQNETVFSHAEVASVLGHPFYDVTRIEQANGDAVTIEHDAAGLRSAIVDQNQQRWTYGYDAAGSLISAGLPGGAGFTIERDERCNAETITDSAGNATRYTYDRYNRNVAVIHPDSARRLIAYDDAGRVVSLTNERDKTVSRTFDGNGNVVTVSVPTMPDITYVYDDMDRVTEMRSPKRDVTGFAYDELGRLEEISGPLGRRNTFGYDKADRPVSLSLGARTPFELRYTAEGLPDAFVAPGILTLDAQSTGTRPGRTDRYSDGAGTVTKVYDDRGRFIGFDDQPGDELLRIEYDERGNVTAFRNYGGAISSEIGYDALNRPIRFRDANGNDWLRAYDGAGRLTGIEDPLGRQTELGYDDRSQVASVSFPDGLGSVTITRNPSGFETERAYSDGTLLEYAYDDIGQPISATGLSLGYDDNGNVANSNGIVVAHDADDRLETVELAPGKTVTYRYDDRGMLTSVEDWMGEAVTFANDEAGLLNGISRANGVNTALDYDVAGRLDTIEEPGIALIDLSYDARGRLTEATRNVPRPAGLVDARTAAYSYDAASQTEQFSHDALGRRTADDRGSYEWNLASRLTGYSAAGVSVAFDYDAMGYRTQRSDGAGNREYVWNYALGLPSVSVERQDGADRRYYVHTPSGDLLYSVEPDGERRFYHYDERGNTLYVTGDSGAVLASYAYTPYGEVIAEQGSIENAFTFMGQRGVMREGDSDLYYARARYYDARTGRFLSRDAERSFSPKRGNPYQYARGNPLMFTDPTGLSEDEEEGWFSSLVRRGGNWLGRQADNLVNAGLGGATLAGRKWDAMADTVRAGLGGTWLSVSSKLDEFVGIRADIRNNTGRPGVFAAGKNVRLSAEQNRILRSITKQRSLARLLENRAFGLNVFGAMVSAITESSDQYTTTAVGQLVGKGVIGGANAAIGHSGGPFATFVGASSLVDAGTEFYYSERYGMEGIRSGAHEVLFNPLRMLVAAGEDFVTEPTSNRDSALYKLAQTMKSAEKDNLGATTFGLYEAGESIEESLGISDYLVWLFAEEDEE